MASTKSTSSSGKAGLLIVDLGSQTTGLIGKVFALLDVPTRTIKAPDGSARGADTGKAICAAFDAAFNDSTNSVAGIVLSGSPASVRGEPEGDAYKAVIQHVLAARTAAAAAADADTDAAPLPVLAVCFGFQALAVLHGGRVEAGPGEYGAAIVEPIRKLPAATSADAWAMALHKCLTSNSVAGKGAASPSSKAATTTTATTANGAGGGAGATATTTTATTATAASPRTVSTRKLHVWSSHGDDVADCGSLHAVAMGAKGAIAAAASHPLRLMAVQWHPEHMQTSDEAGVDVLYTFALACGLKARYLTHSERGAVLLAEVTAQVQTDIAKLDAAAAAKGEKPPAFLVALSGGVDSAVAAGLVAHALRAGKHGVGRLHLCFVDTGLMRDEDAAHVAALAQALKLPLTMLDERAHFFGQLAGVLDDQAVRQAVGKSFGTVLQRQRRALGESTLLVQGTLASDVVESSRIKAHHNVGALPADLVAHVFEPLRLLFKSDVRQLAAGIGLGPDFVTRRPFPGPGLALRVVGAEVNEANVAIARGANAVWREVLQRHSVQFAQSLACVCPTITFVGVRGDERTRGCLCILRAVVTRDFMTAWPAEVPHHVLHEAQAAIMEAVPAIGRVSYDVTSKPPACVEFR